MRIKILNLNIKMTRQKKNFKTVSVHYKNANLILKMIKKAKISRVRVPFRIESSYVSLDTSVVQTGKGGGRFIADLKKLVQIFLC